MGNTSENTEKDNKAEDTSAKGNAPKDTSAADMKQVHQMMQEMQEQIAVLQQSLTAVQDENAALKAQVEKSGNTKPAEKVKPTVPTDTFKVGKMNYQFVSARFVLPKTKEREAMELTAIDALDNQAVLAELVERKSGAIKEVV